MHQRISNISQSQQFINSNSDVENILEHVTDHIYKFGLRPSTLKEDTQSIIANIKNDLFKNREENEDFNRAIECIVHNEIYDEIMCKLKEMLSTEDFSFFEKCKYFSKSNITPQLLGSRAYNIIPKLAIVELSLLDNYKSPMEKLICISSVYDLIFAEMKGSRISIISQYSDKEIDIPVIENKEIIPVLMAVIIKSKLMYLVSNFCYIKKFGKLIYENEKNMSHIVKVYEEAVENILNVRSLNFKKFPQLSPCLDVCESIKFVSETETNNDGKEEETFQEEKRRLKELITTATTQNLCNF